MAGVLDSELTEFKEPLLESLCCVFFSKRQFTVTVLLSTLEHWVILILPLFHRVGGAVASWLVSSTLDRVVRV